MKIAIKNSEGKKQGELEVKFALVETGRATHIHAEALDRYQRKLRATPTGL